MKGKAILCSAALLLALCHLQPAPAQNPVTKYPSMAPVGQYLMDRNAEIALARSAAPQSVSRDATVLVLGRHGYETALTGKNGFVCLVARGLVGAFDWPEYWNPKIRGAECLNPQAARSILPYDELRTSLALAGDATGEIVAKVQAALRQGKIPALEPGAMSYMMAKGSYLTDQGSHNAPHLMFYVLVADAASWGANLPGSPVGSGPFWFFSRKANQKYTDLPTIRVFTVNLTHWSDGTPAPKHHLGWPTCRKPHDPKASGFCPGSTGG